MRILLLAIRNLTRHKRRTLVTSLTVCLGAIAIVLLQGMVNGLIRSLVETSVLAKIGAVQVFRAGYLGSEDPLTMTIEDDPALVARIQSVDGVLAVAPRLDFDGMVSNGSEATMFLATAIDPALEYRVCPKRATYVAKGSTPLGPNAGHELIVGKAIADSLGARQGSALVIQAAGPHAGTNALDAEVHGFLPLTHPMESKRLATLPLAFAQDLLRMKGRITEYVVSVPDLDRVEEVAARIHAAIGNEYHVTTWRELDPGTRDRANMLRYILGFVALVLFVLIATGIVNTMMMSVYERVREIGTLLAVGVRSWQISSLFLWEALSLGLVSATFGAVAGFAFIRHLARTGVNRRAPGGDLVTYYPDVSSLFLLLVITVCVVDTAFAAVYPAWKASRMRPVDALRANG